MMTNEKGAEIWDECQVLHHYISLFINSPIDIE